MKHKFHFNKAPLKRLKEFIRVKEQEEKPA